MAPICIARHVCIDIHSHLADAVVSVASHEKHDPCIRMTRRGFDSSRKRIVVAEPYDPQETVRADAQNLEKCTKFAFSPGRSHSLHFVLLA